MKILPTERKFQGYSLRQVYASKYAYIYVKSFEGAVVSHEVFERVVVNPSARLGGAFDKRTEPYPSTSDFGRCAWDCNTLENAMQRAQQIEAKHRQPVALVEGKLRIAV